MDPGELVFYLESLQVLIDLFFFFPFSSNLVLSFSLLRLLLTDKWFLLKKKKKKKGSFLFLGPESMPANGKMGIVKKKNWIPILDPKEKTSSTNYCFHG